MHEAAVIVGIPGPYFTHIGTCIQCTVPSIYHTCKLNTLFLRALKIVEYCYKIENSYIWIMSYYIWIISYYILIYFLLYFNYFLLYFYYFLLYFNYFLLSVRTKSKFDTLELSLKKTYTSVIQWYWIWHITILHVYSSIQNSEDGFLYHITNLVVNVILPWQIPLNHTSLT